MTAVDTVRQAPAALTTPLRQRHETALHEAAHAVAAFRTGTRFEELILDPPLEPTWLGILTLPAAPSYVALAVVLCAGIVMDLRLGHVVPDRDGSDVRELLQLAVDLERETGRPARAVLVEAFGVALGIVRRQHAAIRRVTVALLVDGRLSYDEARRVAQLPGTIPRATLRRTA